MNRTVSGVFLGLSLAFFLFIVGLTGYRIETTRSRNAAAARERLPALAARVTSIIASNDSFGSPLFRRDMQDAFNAEPRLLLLSVHSPSEGILYLVARNRDWLEEPAAPNPQWRGTPVYRVSRGYEVALSSSVGDPAAGRIMDALFVIMGREDLYPIVRDDLYLFLAFLLVTGVLILIVMSLQEDVPPAPPVPPVSRMPEEHIPRGPVHGNPPGPAPGPGPGHGSAGAAGEDGFDTSAGPGGTGLTSARSGLVRAEHFEARLAAELERAAASDQDISVARLRIDDPFVDSALPVVYAEIARMLRESFPIADCVFESGNHSYSLLLPESDIDAAVRSLEAFRTKVAREPLAGRTRAISVGVTSRGGRLLEGRDLLEEADISLAKASREGGNQVIGFRADAARFRESLTGSRP